MHPMEAVRDDGRVRVLMEEIVFGTTGFSISARIRLTPADVPLPGDALYTTLTWMGFDRVFDDRGNHYLLQGFRLVGMAEQRLQMSFHPAVASDALRLTFISNPAMVEVSGVGLAEGPGELPELDIGEIAWEVAVPSRSR